MQLPNENNDIVQPTADAIPDVSLTPQQALPEQVSRRQSARAHKQPSRLAYDEDGHK